MEFEDNLYAEQSRLDSTTTRERKQDRWNDEQEALLKKVVMEVKKEQSGSMRGGESALFDIVSERLKTHGSDRTALACKGKWKRMKKQLMAGKDSQANASYDTVWEVESSEQDETFEVEFDDETWETPKPTDRKAAQRKQDSRKNVPSRGWTEEEELIFSDYIKSFKTRQEQGKESGLKTSMNKKFFESMVEHFLEKGYTRTYSACRSHWNNKIRRQLDGEKSPESSSITVTPNATLSTPRSTSDARSDENVVSDMITADEVIASGSHCLGTIRLSEGGTLPSQEQVAGDIDNTDAQVSSNVFSDNGVDVPCEQKALLEVAFSKGMYLTIETLQELCVTTRLASCKIQNWYSKKREVANKEKETVSLAAKIEKDSSNSMAQLNEINQGNSSTSKHSRTADVISEPLGNERMSSDSRPSKKARYSNGGGVPISGRGDATDMSSDIGDKSTPSSKPAVINPTVGATDSRQRSVETKSSFFPHPEEQISTGYSPSFKGILASERSEFQRRISLAERNQERLDEAIADHTASIQAEELALDQKRKELAQVQERLELAIADHAAKIEAEQLAKDQKENELREWKINRMTNMNDLDAVDKMIRRGNMS